MKMRFITIKMRYIYMKMRFFTLNMGFKRAMTYVCNTITSVMTFIRVITILMSYVIKTMTNVLKCVIIFNTNYSVFAFKCVMPFYNTITIKCVMTMKRVMAFMMGFVINTIHSVITLKHAMVCTILMRLMPGTMTKFKSMPLYNTITSVICIKLVMLFVSNVIHSVMTLKCTITMRLMKHVMTIKHVMTACFEFFKMGAVNLFFTMPILSYVLLSQTFYWMVVSTFV